MYSSLIDFSKKQAVTLKTEQAKMYLQRQCKHFSHKVEVKYNETDALITFEEGICIMKANHQALYLRCEANSPSDLKEITDTMDRHMEGFARGETFDMQWQEL